MNLQRLALLLLLGATLSSTAHAAPPGQPPPASDWWASIQSVLSTDALIVGKQVLLSLLLFLGGWLVAKLISWGVYRGLCKTTFDNVLAAKLRLGVLVEGDAPAAKPSAPNQLERGIANVVFYMLMLLVVVGVLRLAAFSKGFYKLHVQDARVLMTDLRMGQEPSYVFSFAVAERHSPAVPLEYVMTATTLYSWPST